MSDTPEYCACCRATSGVAWTLGVWLCHACAAFHPRPRSTLHAPLDAQRATLDAMAATRAEMQHHLAIIQRIMARVDARERIARGEDGFDG